MDNKTQQEIEGYEMNFGFRRKNYVSYAEEREYMKKLRNKEPLPEGIFRDGGGFFSITELDISKENKLELLSYENAQNIRTIKNCVLFFTVVSVVGIVAGIIALLVSNT